MAKKQASNDHVPGLSNSSQRAVQQIMRLLDESRAATYMHTYEHFSRSLDIWLAALHQVPMAAWLKTWRGMELGYAPLSQALGILMLEASLNYHDLLGSIYMLLSQGEKRLGQYFTPFGVAKLMAGINFTETDFTSRKPGDPPITVYEPTCGSGVLILAAAETVEELRPGAILRGEVQFFGMDLDYLCVKMTQLNVFLHQIGIAKLEGDISAEEVAAAQAAGRPLPALFQPARIVQGDSLLNRPETQAQFRDESLFPWYPINLFLASAQSAKGSPEKPSEVENQNEREKKNQDTPENGEAVSRQEVQESLLEVVPVEAGEAGQEQDEAPVLKETSLALKDEPGPNGTSLLLPEESSPEPPGLWEDDPQARLEPTNGSVIQEKDEAARSRSLAAAPRTHREKARKTPDSGIVQPDLFSLS